MKIIVADSAGFCFGVKRAVETAFQLADSEHNDSIYSFGDIIHNNIVLIELADKGIKVINDADSFPLNDSRVIIRAHGVGEGVHTKLKSRNAEIIDMTCPFVKKIHDIVHNYYNQGYTIVIVGDKNHPEVIGINGWCNNSAIVLYDNFDSVSINSIQKVCVVAQTTITREKWVEAVNFLLDKVKHIIINDTICNATNMRQSEAFNISKAVDLMLIIGSVISSNSQKLYNICLKNCRKSYLIEDASNLSKLFDEEIFKNIESIGITAGASTPQQTINEVLQFLYKKFDINDKNK